MMNEEYLKLENYRLSYLSKYKRYRVIGFLTCIILIGFIFLGVAKKVKEEYEEKGKKRFFILALKEAYGNAKYDEYDSIVVRDVMASRLYHEIGNCSGEDRITGVYKNVKFDVSDLTLCKEVERTDVSSKHISYSYFLEYFKGRWFTYTIPGEFKANVIVKETNSVNDIDTNGLVEVQTESIVLSQKFKVYSSNELDCLKVLTPQFIDKIISLEKLFDGQIAFSFNKNKLFIAINDHKDYFETNLFTPITDESVKILRSQVDIIGAIINEFSLDRIEK